MPLVEHRGRKAKDIGCPYWPYGRLPSNLNFDRTKLLKQVNQRRGKRHDCGPYAEASHSRLMADTMRRRALGSTVGVLVISYNFIFGFGLKAMVQGRGCGSFLSKILRNRGGNHALTWGGRFLQRCSRSGGRSPSPNRSGGGPSIFPACVRHSKLIGQRTSSCRTISAEDCT